MYDKKDFFASVKHETKIITHLAAQLTPAHLDYRPTPKQRSTLELLRFLTIAGSAATAYALTEKWDHWEGLDAKAQSVTLATFAKAMKAQIAYMTKALAKTNDAALKRKQVKSFTGAKMSLGAGLVEMALKQLVAYRMQLFLYAKSSGLAHLGTSDCWRGTSPKAAKA